MYKLFLCIFSFTLCYLAPTHVKAQKILMIFVEGEFSQTIKDRTKPNNIRGYGLGAEAILRTKTKFSPLVNFSSEFIFLDDKVYRTNADGSEMTSIGRVVNLQFGTNYTLYRNLYVAFVAGPSFINGQTLAGIKPSIGFYFPRSKKALVKISHMTIFNRNSGKKENYSSLLFSVGVRLF